MNSAFNRSPARSSLDSDAMHYSNAKKLRNLLRVVIIGCVLLLSQMRAYAQVPVGAGSQLGEDFLRARAGKTTNDTIGRSMIVSWVQGYVVGCARSMTDEPQAAEIANRIKRGELPPDLDRVLSDPNGQLLALFQKKFGTVSGWVFDPPDGKTVETWLTSYCQHHPASRINDAAATLTNELVEQSKAKH